VLYRLAPEFPFPAAVDDSVAVYKELLKTYKPDHIIIYGTSAGAILTAEVAVKLKQLGLPQPAALGIFSGMGDFARAGDSASMYALRGLSGIWMRQRLVRMTPTIPVRPTSRTRCFRHLRRPARAAAHAVHYQRTRPAAERDGEPSSRYLHAGVDARLVVFDALPHAFWYSRCCRRQLKRIT